MHAFRSPFRVFIVGMVGVVLIVAAIDVMFIHVVSSAPTGSPGQLDTRGLAQQRGDIIWGAGMIGMGVILFGSSLIELIRRKPAVDVRDDGLYAQIGANSPDVLIPWADIALVSSTILEDPFDGSVREQLVISVIDTKEIPPAISGATWFGSDLHIDAHDWNRSVTDIALAAQGARKYATRASTEPAVDEPAMMWETSVDVSDEGTPESQDGADGP
ncbi:MAG: hypothetical protein O3B42_02955 [Actinomycetota bacterium]|nr:hypothetical protein [Actinomycetota bacterium]